MTKSQNCEAFSIKCITFSPKVCNVNKVQICMSTERTDIREKKNLIWAVPALKQSKFSFFPPPHPIYRLPEF